MQLLADVGGLVVSGRFVAERLVQGDRHLDEQHLGLAVGPDVPRRRSLQQTLEAHAGDGLAEHLDFDACRDADGEAEARHPFEECVEAQPTVHAAPGDLGGSSTLAPN